MKVYKFGGASVKDSDGVRNLARILQNESNAIIVISAMDKTTKALERIVDLYMESSPDLFSHLQSIFQYHNSICIDLFENKNLEIFSEIKELEQELITFIKLNRSPKRSFIYDQIVFYGEMLSTKIVSEFLNDQGIIN